MTLTRLPECLPVKEFAVLRCRLVLDISTDETAVKLGVRVTAVYELLRSAKEKALNRATCREVKTSRACMEIHVVSPKI